MRGVLRLWWLVVLSWLLLMVLGCVVIGVGCRCRLVAVPDVGRVSAAVASCRGWCRSWCHHAGAVAGVCSSCHDVGSVSGSVRGGGAALRGGRGVGVSGICGRCSSLWAVLCGGADGESVAVSDRGLSGLWWRVACPMPSGCRRAGHNPQPVQWVGPLHRPVWRRACEC